MSFDDILYEFLSEFYKISKTKKRDIDSANSKSVIDISLDKEEIIPKEKFNQNSIVKDYKYWILKLDRYYKNSAMRVQQLNSASLKMYASLCDSLEAHLNEKGTTTARLVSKLIHENFYYDLYYTIYLIAENKVLSFYNPMYDRKPEKSYKIIEDYISKDARDLLEKRAVELSKDLKSPDKETIEFFKLTKNNKVSLWWDKDGLLREKYNISKNEELAINQISKRKNVVWKNSSVIEILLDMYLYTLRKVFDCDKINNKNLITITSPYIQSELALESILIISEKNIRELFLFFNKNNPDKAKKNLEEIDEVLIDFIESIQKEYIKNLDLDIINGIYEKYLLGDSAKTKDHASYINRLDLKSKIYFIEKIKKLDKFPKILDALIKSNTKEDKIIALYYIYKYDFNKKSHDNILFGIIKSENFDEFISLVKSKDVNAETIGEIEKLNKNKLKKINVDMARIDQSRDNLKKTVSMVNEFLEDEILEEELSEDTKKEITNEEDKYIKILKLIVEYGAISKDTFSEFAIDENLTMNTYLGKINDELFDYIGDQTLLIEDNNVIIDPFYVEMVKEYIDGDKN